MGTVNISLDAFRVVANSSFSDSRHVYIANKDKSALAFNGDKNAINADGTKTKILDGSGKPRTFKKPGKADAAGLQQDSVFLRCELLRAASTALGGKGSAAFETIKEKLFGKLADAQNDSFTKPLKKREIMDVIKLVDDELKANAEYDGLQAKDVTTRDGKIKHLTKQDVQKMHVTAKLTETLFHDKKSVPDDDGAIVNGKDLKVDSNADLRPCTKNPFRHLTGGTSDVVKKLAEDAAASGKKFKVLAQIFADCTNFLCYFANPTCHSQEEFVSHDTEPKSFLSIVRNGFAKKAGKLLKYVLGKDGSPLLSTVKGWMKSCKLKFCGGERLKDPIKAQYLFSSMPSLTQNAESFDVQGNVEYMCQCRELLTGKAATKADRAKFTKLINAMYDPVKKYQTALKDYTKKLLNDPHFEGERPQPPPDYLNPEQFKEAMKILLFSPQGDKDSLFNPDAKNPAKEVTKLLKLVRSNGHQDLLATAQKNYEDTLRASVRNWIVMARKDGVTHFDGGAIGTGAFENDPKTIAKIIAEEFVKYGGDMEYVFPQLSDKDEGNRLIFEEAFKEAFERFGQKGNEAAQVNT